MEGGREGRERDGRREGGERESGREGGRERGRERGGQRDSLLTHSHCIVHLSWMPMHHMSIMHASTWSILHHTR